MKKIVYVVILLVAVIVAFFAGMAVGKGGRNKSVVGVYETDSWNGKTGTLVLYKDGSCQYPSGGKATWVLDGDTVHITLESKYTKENGGIKGINIIISSDLSQEKTQDILNIIESFANIESLNWNAETHLCQITLIESESENITGKELGKIEGVMIMDIVKETGVETTEYKAKVMENGVVLHEKFFEKVSD